MVAKPAGQAESPCCQPAMGCEGPVKPEGDVPGSVSFTGTLPYGVGDKSRRAEEKAQEEEGQKWG